MIECNIGYDRVKLKELIFNAFSEKGDVSISLEDRHDADDRCQRFTPDISVKALPAFGTRDLCSTANPLNKNSLPSCFDHSQCETLSRYRAFARHVRNSKYRSLGVDHCK
jgi:hypothetical protein